MKKPRYDKNALGKRPTRTDPGIPASPLDKLGLLSVEEGSRQLINALWTHHHKIVKQLVEKNGNGNSRIIIPE